MQAARRIQRAYRKHRRLRMMLLQAEEAQASNLLWSCFEMVFLAGCAPKMKSADAVQKQHSHPKHNLTGCSGSRQFLSSSACGAGGSCHEAWPLLHCKRGFCRAAGLLCRPTLKPFSKEKHRRGRRDAKRGGAGPSQNALSPSVCVCVCVCVYSVRRRLCRTSASLATMFIKAGLQPASSAVAATNLPRQLCSIRL